jgi:gliding motility associated protien GldN
MKRTLILTLLALSTASFAQEIPPDGYLNTNDFKDVAPTPYPEIKPMDILSVKRVWRDIDTEVDANKLFVSPNSRLIDILVDAIQSGKLIAYSPLSTAKNPSGDAFTEPLSKKDALAKFIGDSVLVPILDKNGNTIKSQWQAGEFSPEKVTKFRLKEDWIFDKGRGIYEPRIVGIAPLVNISAMGELLSEQPAFWINFNQARKVLAQHQVIFKSTNNLSFDDVFVLRKFSSTIIKESNPDDLKIADYASSIEEREKESKRIEDSLSEYKKRIWNKSSTKTIN